MGGGGKFLTSALHVHLHVVLDPLQEDKSGFSFLRLITQVQSIK